MRCIILSITQSLAIFFFNLFKNYNIEMRGHQFINRSVIINNFTSSLKLVAV